MTRFQPIHIRTVKNQHFRRVIISLANGRLSASDGIQINRRRVARALAEQVAPGESAGAATAAASERTARDELSFRTGVDPRAIAQFDVT